MSHISSSAFSDTKAAATMLAAVEDTDIPVVYSAVTDPAAAGFDGEENITGTSDALNTDAIMNLIVAANPGIDTIGLALTIRSATIAPSTPGWGRWGISMRLSPRRTAWA